MPSFALVAEGITDQVIIERIIFTAASNLIDDIDDEADIQPLQPLRDATDQSRVADGNFGGWERVREFCLSPERLEEALEFNDYLVIHLDTDMCEHPNFNVPLLEEGQAVPTEKLLSLVTTKVWEWLGERFYESHGNRIIFAIAVHSTECWLLTHYGRTDSDKCRELACYVHLERNLTRLDRRIEKTHRSFSELSTCFRKHKDLVASRGISTSLEAFLTSLEEKLAQRKSAAG
ncbi:hypothetical protein [Pseudomonas sp. BF-R-16]|uniref:hypothetical protein n=1 Tax=Pseudomonas sp. BF-R-16 TaxID=2832362 RepID=UPI001CBE4C3E|nr:hypothetical protein [Pseudomonas sp. BF-R-16]